MDTTAWLGLTLPLVLLPFAAARAEPLASAAERISAELRPVWLSDPLTRGRPYPAVELLASGTQALAVCPEAKQGGALPTTSAVYCPSSGKVLLEARWLRQDMERDGDWSLAYWIATGLAQAILRQADPPQPALTGAARHLQANCVAGLLLHQSRSLRPSQESSWDTPAFKAYPAAANASQGTAAQRSYALLSGMGVTASSCASRAMVALAEGSVPDPELLRKLREDPTSRARAIQRLQSPETVPPRGLSGGLSI
jgi:hypothetical protein